MSDKKVNPKHSVGKGAQSEQHNSGNEDSYVENPKKKKSGKKENGGDYLEMKWKKISTDFQQKYKMEIDESEYKEGSFSEVLERLEIKTGKPRATLEKEIREW